MTFRDRVAAAADANDSLLCVGLDPDPALMPAVSILQFNKAIVDATHDLVCAYKPNLAFYLAYGLEGLEALYETVSFIDHAVPVIGDAKSSDVGHTASAYARGLLETFGFDAVTVNPYLGFDGVEPFLSYGEKGIFVLCRTSNPGAGELQNLRCVEATAAGPVRPPVPLYELVARRALEWNRTGNLGLVVGATSPDELRRIREICPEMLLLIPGIGAQGGDLEATLRAGGDARGGGLIVNSSRQIIYASRELDFPRAARKAALALRDQINTLRRGQVAD